MSLDDLPSTASSRPRARAEVVSRVDRAPALPGKITRAEELRLQLADDIVHGVLPPGAALDETEIAQRFSVSRTPVREALRQLAASGLVEARAHRGAVVARPSLQRLSGMFEAMGGAGSAVRGAGRGTDAGRGAAGPSGDSRGIARAELCRHPERFHAFNEHFHNAVYAGAQN